MARGTAKFKHRGRNEHGVMSTNKENSLTAVVGHVIEGLKSSAEKFVLAMSVHILHT